ncbi:MAG TPA: hypothetical protein PLM74_01705, partial [Bacillota bacterium]|nr:hypothetical protein [Bacillota bacterium]
MKPDAAVVGPGRGGTAAISPGSVKRTKISGARREERWAYVLLVMPAVLVYWAVMAFPAFFS